MDLFTCSVCGFDGDVAYEEGGDGQIRCMACQARAARLTDQALLLFRALQRRYLDVRGASTWEAETVRLAKAKYRAYRRWKRRDAVVPGHIRPTFVPFGQIAHLLA
jgi:hypothetical protein